MRLPAVLSLSIAWLLALACGAASNAANAVALSRRHHHHLKRAPKLTQAQEFLKADLEAAEDFVRRCAVVVTVSDHKFLPLKPLDKFCRTTDAVMECRMKVGQRLKETHARDGDMGKFCSAVYDWFQGKYGMKCPNQCRKLQCKSTCMWLGAKKKLNSDNIQIKDDMLAAEKALKAIKGMAENVANQLAAEKKLKFAIKMLNVKLERAKTSLAAKKKDHTSAKTKMGKVDTAYKKLENTIAATKESLIKQDDAIMKQNFAIDKAKLKLEAMTRSVQRDTDRAKEDTEEQKSLEADSGKLSKSISEVNATMAGLEKSKASDEKAATKQAAAMKSKIDAMLKAAKELDAWKVAEKSLVQEDAAPAPAAKGWEQVYGEYINGNYKNDPSVPIIKELVQNQHKRVKTAEKELNAVKKKIRDTKDEIKELVADRTRLQKQQKEADDAATAAKTKATDLEKKAKDGSAAAATFKNASVTTPLGVLQKAQAKRKNTDASKAKAERTLKHMGELVQEQQGKLDAANGAVSNADLTLKGIEEEIATSGDTLKNSQNAISKNQKGEKFAKEKLAKEEKVLVDRIKVYKVAVKDLDKHKPEIVRQHGLQPEL